MKIQLPHHTFTLAAALILAAYAQPTFAIVGGSGIDANTGGSTWSGVVSISTSSGTYSGVLIEGGYVLTAAHVAASSAASPGSLLVNFNTGISQSIAATAITIHPGYTGTTPGSDGLWHEDLALIKLSAAAPSDATSYSLFSGTPTRGTTITLVGYGSTGNGTTGATGGSNSSVKRVGENKIDLLAADDDSAGAGYTGTGEIIVFDFDDPANTLNAFSPSTSVRPNEAQFGSGDSGSPVFAQVGGEYQLIGIASFNGIVNRTVDGVSTPLSSSSTSFGSIGGATSVSAYNTWIASVTAVPETPTYAMLLAGLGLVGFYRRRKTAQR